MAVCCRTRDRARVPPNFKYASEKSNATHKALSVTTAVLLNNQGPLQVPEGLPVPQDPQASTYQQDDTPTAAEVPALQENDWDQQAGWDFQDVPLDSPRSNRHTSTSLKGSPDRSAAHVARQGMVSPGQSNSQDMPLAALQKANDALTRRLKHVETVRIPYLGLTPLLLLLLLKSVSLLPCLQRVLKPSIKLVHCQLQHKVPVSY